MYIYKCMCVEIPTFFVFSFCVHICSYFPSFKECFFVQQLLFFWSQIFLFLLLSASFFLFYTEFLCCKSSGILCSIVSGPPFHYDYLCFRAFLPSRSPMFRKTISTSLIFYNCYIVKSRGRAGRYLGAKRLPLWYVRTGKGAKRPGTIH